MGLRVSLSGDRPVAYVAQSLAHIEMHLCPSRHSIQGQQQSVGRGKPENPYGKANVG